MTSRRTHSTTTRRNQRLLQKPSQHYHILPNPPAPLPQLGATARRDIRTHRRANKTSVTLNLLSTLHGLPASTSSSPVTLGSSPRKVNAQRRPHHTAGAVLRARQKRSGKCQRLSTPSRTATRGCSRDLFSRDGGADWRAARSVLFVSAGGYAMAGGDCGPAWG